MKNKKVFFYLVIFINFFANALELDRSYPDLKILEFQHERDAHDAARILFQNHEMLFGTPEFNVTKMLATKSLTPDIADTHGSLHMLLLKKPSPDSLMGFVAYEVNNEEKIICYKLLVVCAEHRKKGVGSFFMQTLANLLIAKGYKHAIFETRLEKNKEAVAFYDHLFAQFPGVFVTKKAMQVPNKQITDVIRYTISLNKQ